VQIDPVQGEPIICLQCGTPNLSNALACVKCNTPLVIMDEDFNLIPSISAQTNMGQVRKNNEDNIHVWVADGVILALVADGMGGAAAGEEASRLVVENVESAFMDSTRNRVNFQTLSESQIEEMLRVAINRSNHAVIDRAAADQTMRGMGTTSTLALIRGNRLLVAHVGDSRAYIIDSAENRISQVTNDHSFVQALVISGHLTPEQAENHPMGNVLYRALGQSPDLDIDLYTRTLKAGDKVLLCSDGLTKHISPEETKEIVLHASTPEQATETLIEIANERGGEDNISIVIVAINGTGEPPTLITI
jgi:protein phosphatase